MNVLYVGSELEVRAELRSVLREGAGIRLDVVRGSSDALRALQDHHHQVVMLAWGGDASVWDGSGLCRAISRTSPRVGVIVLSDTEGLQHKLSAFEAGADDYIEAPCDPEEVLARARAVARRSSPPPKFAPRFDEPRDEARRPELNTKTCQLTGPEARTTVTPTELRLLLLLNAATAEGIATGALAFELLSRDDEHACNLVHRHLSNLRKKLKQTGLGGVVVRGRYGYLLRVKVSAAGEP
jgi:DNA-binding response OmpR family regulator